MRPRTTIGRPPARFHLVADKQWVSVYPRPCHHLFNQATKLMIVTESALTQSYASEGAIFMARVATLFRLVPFLSTLPNPGLKLVGLSDYGQRRCSPT